MYHPGECTADPCFVRNAGRDAVSVGYISVLPDTTRISITWGGGGEASLVASLQAPADAQRAAAETYGMIGEMLNRHRLAIVHERIFGSLSQEFSVMAERRRSLERLGISPGNPVTYVQGHPAWGEGLAGVIIQAAPAMHVRTVLDGGKPCGRAWQSNGAEFLMLQNITGTDAGSSAPVERTLQVRRMLDRVDRILRGQGGSYRDVLRTWFYLSDILDWYGDFNRARNETYGEFGIMPGPSDGSLLLPASTGISGETGSGAAATMDLLAVVGNPTSPPAITQLTNRRQLDAFRYGAAFSRGAVIRNGDATIIQVSGTAAIDERGVSLHPGNIRSQIDCTFDKIEGLLAQENAGLGDICAATVFVKRSEHAEVFWKMAADRGLGDFPAVCAVADVCREELLFEIDAEAVVRIEPVDF